MVNNMSNVMSITDQDLVKEEPILLMSPRNPVPTETILLSNIDQAVTFPVETVFFYEAPPNMAASTVGIAGKVRKAVEEVLLVPYYFMAGRLNFSDETKRLELVCNNAGALFVTRFECGGFALGFTTNHAILDGKSASEMFHNLASICRGEGLKNNHINNDRTCLKARTPPQIHFPHTEYVKLARTSSLVSSFTSQKRPSPSPHVFSDKYTHKLFSFTPQMLKFLKQKAMIKCSTFEAILAHIWRARTRAVLGHDRDQDQDSTVLFAVDIRDMISPPLPSSFIGNAVITGDSSNLWMCILCVSLVEIGFWGGGFRVWKAKHAGPILSGNDEFVLLLDGGDCDEGGKGLGINVWIGLEKEKMERFLQCVFDM
ncbi:UNVERIFIED_CONTAM: 3'-N-debenzoyl-2'-deoxytaxol N-benzoyltransferase [Sesamum angustifolium]|uniref:3'-N-debenzoyl-2'-deoxytaxol N-benzoyltransferase n=1 Tax=Sesamum angustifolium TaxID=2727405 RepID=A0AAW2LXC8_9LAMI